MTYEEMIEAIDWNKIPSMIAHEVQRSHDYFQQEQYFLVIFQIKDMYEVMIKTLALTAIASYETRFKKWHKYHTDKWYHRYCEIKTAPSKYGTTKAKLQKLFKQVCNIKRQDIISPETNEIEQYSFEEISEYCKYRYVLNTILNKPLSLGDWVLDILQKTASFLYLPQGLQKLVDDLAARISNDNNNSFNLTRWRNNEIGHGALTVEASEEYISDIKKMLSIIMKIIYENSEALYKLEYQVQLSNQTLILKGKQAISNLPNGDFKIHLQLDTNLIEVDPFLIVRRNGLYLFDTFVPFRQSGYSIDYPRGIRYKSHEDLINWCIRLKNNIPEGQGFTFNSVNDIAIDTEAAEQLSKLPELKDFIVPSYLVNKVTSFIENNEDGGLYLLYLERGMGKSYFAKGLHQKGNTNPIFDEKETDWSFRTLHLNTYTLYNGDLFKDALPKTIIPGILTKDYSFDGNHDDDKSTKQRNTAKYLNYLKKDFFDDNYLILVIDGLDELPFGERNSILDYIPSKDMLDDEIFIILTSRTKDTECSSATIFTEIEGLSNDLQIQTETILSDSIEYKNFINIYLKKRKVNLSEGLKERLLEDKETRKLVFLSLLAECLTYEPSLKIEEGENIVFTYLKMLIQRIEARKIDLPSELCTIENKYIKIILDVITVLIIQDRPLNLFQIKYLIRQYTNDFELLGILKDIKSLLKIERSQGRHTLFSIGHQYLKLQAAEVLSKHIDQVKKYHIELIQDFTVKSLDILLQNAFANNTDKRDTEIMTIIDNISGIYTLFSSLDLYLSLEERSESFELFEKIYTLVKGLSGIHRFFKQHELLRLYRIKLYGSIHDFICSHRPLSDKEFEIYKQVYLDYCTYLRDSNSHKDLLQAEEYMEQFLKEMTARNMDKDEFYSDFLQQYCFTLRRLTKRRKAIEIARKSLLFYETNNSGNRARYAEKIADVGIDIRNLFFEPMSQQLAITNADLLEEGILNSTKAIEKKLEVRESYEKNKNLESIGFTYHSRGLSFYYKAVYLLLSKNSIKHEETYYFELFKAIDTLRNLPMTDDVKEVLKESLKDYTKSIGFFSEASKQNRNTKTNVLAYCHSHAGDTYALLGRFEDALQAYAKACDIFNDTIELKNATLYKLHLYTLINSIHLDESNPSIHQELTNLITVANKQFFELKIRDSYYKKLQQLFPNKTEELKLFA